MPSLAEMAERLKKGVEDHYESSPVVQAARAGAAEAQRQVDAATQAARAEYARRVLQAAPAIAAGGARAEQAAAPVTGLAGRALNTMADPTVSPAGALVNRVANGGTPQRLQKLAPGQGDAAGQVDPSKLSFAEPGGGGGGDAFEPHTFGGGGGGGTYIPPQYGYQKEGRATQTQEGVRLSPETQAQRAAATQAERAASVMDLGATQEEAVAAAEQKKKEAAQLAANTQAENLSRGANAEKLESGRKALDDDLANVEAEQVDPERYWHNLGAFQKAMSIVGVIIGGFLEGYQGTPNRALQMLTKHVDDDIASQKDLIASKRWAHGERVNRYHELVNELGSQEAADAQARVEKYQQVLKEGEAVAASLGSKRALANWAKGAAGIEDKIAAEAEKRDEATQDRVTTHETERYGVTPGTGVGGGGGGGPTEKEIQAKAWDLIQKGATPVQARAMAESWATQGTGYGASGTIARGGAGGRAEAERGQKLANLDSAAKEIQDVHERGPLYASSPAGRARLDAAGALFAESYQGAVSGSNKQNQTGVEIAHQLVAGGGILRSDITGRTRATMGAVRKEVAAIRAGSGASGGGGAAMPPMMDADGAPAEGDDAP